MSTEPPNNDEVAQTASGTDETISEADAAVIAAAMAEDGPPAAKSLKCTDCGKLFKNADLANYHAEKSGHENFEESKEEVIPLILRLILDQTTYRRREKGEIGGTESKDVDS
jgi:hypothetical protein